MSMFNQEGNYAGNYDIWRLTFDATDKLYFKNRKLHRLFYLLRNVRK